MNNYKKWLIVLAVYSSLIILLAELMGSLKRIESLALSPEGFSIEINYAFFESDNINLTATDVAGETERFLHQTFNRARVDFGDKVYWYQLQLRNVKNSPRSLVVLFDNPMLDVIDVIDGQSLQLIKQLGDSRHALTPSEIAFPHVSVWLPAGEAKTIWVKTQTTGTPNLPFAVFYQNDFEAYKEVVYMLWGCFIGIILLTAVYNLILYLGAKDTLYLLYVGYIACFLLVLGVVHGFLIYLLPYQWFSLVSEKVIFWFYLLGYFMLAFALRFLKFDEEPEHIVTRAGNLLLKVILMLAVVSLFVVEYQAAQVFFVVQGVVYLLALIMVTIKLRYNLSWAKYYVISWLPLFVGAAVGPMMLTGNLEYSFWTRHALLLGVMFEMTFISMALAERLRMSENERLYEASHDHRFGFANTSLLEKMARWLSSHQETYNFSVVVVAVEKYESIVPYLSPDNLKKLVYEFASDVEQHLASQLLLAEIDNTSRFKHTVMLREGVFSFLVSSNDDALLTKVLNDFAIRQPMAYQLPDLSINVSCLIGAAANTKGKTEPHELINQAQQAVDSAIEHMKRCWIYCGESKSEEGRKVRLASDLQAAIEQNELQLFHQPQIDLQRNEIKGSEVLLRWQHPVIGNIAPDEFVAVAENTGLINRLSNWVFDMSCQHMSRLKEMGLNQHTISVNFSAFDVMLESFVASLVSKLNEYGLSADSFILELTETVSVTDTRRFDLNLLELRELGFHIAMDDFGTGYSSLTYVSRHPFNELKIDREFVMDLSDSAKHQSIVKATVNMAAGLNLTVVAEGIEDKRSLTMLQSFGCAYGQGYLFAKPMAFQDYLNWLDAFDGNLVSDRNA